MRVWNCVLNVLYTDVPNRNQGDLLAILHHCLLPKQVELLYKRRPQATGSFFFHNTTEANWEESGFRSTKTMNLAICCLCFSARLTDFCPDSPLLLWLSAGLVDVHSLISVFMAKSNYSGKAQKQKDLMNSQVFVSSCLLLLLIESPWFHQDFECSISFRKNRFTSLLTRFYLTFWKRFRIQSAMLIELLIDLDLDLCAALRALPRLQPCPWHWRKALPWCLWTYALGELDHPTRAQNCGVLGCLGSRSGLRILCQVRDSRINITTWTRKIKRKHAANVRASKISLHDIIGV